jgi:hypothetical protein
MGNLYYLVWVDCITSGMKNPENNGKWKVMAMIFMTVAMTSNLLLLLTILQKHILGYYFYWFEIEFLPQYLSNILTYFILFVLPSFFVNYFFIFYKKRYEVLMKRYRTYDGKLFGAYFAASLLVPVILLIGVLIYHNVLK